MKSIIFTALLAATTLASISSAYAAPHHRDCHKVRVHHHWVTRCR